MRQPKPDPVLRDPRWRKVNRLLGRAGPGLQQLHRDGCRVVDGELPSLETAVNVLGNCAREIESAVRGLFVDLVVEHVAEPPCDERCARCAKKIRHVGDTHRQQIEQVLAALEAHGSGARAGVARAHGPRKRHAPTRARARAPAHARASGDWRRLEDVMAILLPHLEERPHHLAPAVPRARGTPGTDRYTEWTIGLPMYSDRTWIPDELEYGFFSPLRWMVDRALQQSPVGVTTP